MKKITFTRSVIKTEEVLEYVVLDLEENEQYLDMEKGVTIDKVSAWARSDKQDDQEALDAFIWENQCYGEIVGEDFRSCFDVQVEEIFDITEADD